MSKVQDLDCYEYYGYLHCYRCEIENDCFYVWSKYDTKELVFVNEILTSRFRAFSFHLTKFKEIAFENDIDPKLFNLVS